MTMRLDIYLFKSWLFSSRNQAQEAILRWDILVNWKVIRKFSYKVKVDDKVEILNSEKPRWYWKLKLLNEKFKIFHFWKKYNILDLGSSRGGFLLYAGEYANSILWIEISKQFENDLKQIVSNFQNKGIKADIWFEDIFKVDVKKVNKFFEWEIDVILADLTLEPQISWLGIVRFLSILKEWTRIVWVHKWKRKIYNNFWNNIKIIDFFESKDRDEIYFYLMIE